MSEIIKYAIDAKDAFTNYVTLNKEINEDLAKKIYEYIQNIEKLTEEEKMELNEFIGENLYETVHLADVKSPVNESKLIKQFLRMTPYTFTTPDGNINRISGNIEPLINSKELSTLEVKVRKITYKAA